MTRISSSIKPIELCDKMLIAEHREIKRIPNAIKNGKALVKDIPNSYRLGTGHVKFFYNKLAYLHERYKELLAECKERGFNVTDYNECFEDLPTELYKNWEEGAEVRKIVVERINERLSTMKAIKYYSDDIPLQNITLI